MKKLTEDYENPLVRRSKEIIAKAFFERLSENPYKKIRISDICTRAGVSRSTFYKHYDSVEDVPYEHYLRDWYTGLVDLLDRLVKNNFPMDEVSILSIELVLKYWREHKDEFDNLQTAGMESVLIDLFSQGSKTFYAKFMRYPIKISNPIILECLISQGALATLSTIKIWFNTGMELSVREMAETMAIIFRPDRYELLHQRFEQK